MQALDLLIQVLQKAKTQKDLENLLSGLLTPGEIQELGQRIEIVMLLKKGMGQHNVAKKLNVGVATVSRGAKEIKIGNFKVL